MNPAVSSQQAYFFKHNGYIEFEEFLAPEECNAMQQHIDSALFARLKRDSKRVPESELYRQGRDLWRESDALKTTLLSRKMSAIAFGLTDKSPLHLACDQWMPPLPWPRAIQAQDLFSIQGLACLYFIRLTPASENEPACGTFALEPGLIPLPKERGSLLVIRPNLLLNLPKLALSPASLYMIAYALPHAVYRHNSEDPSNHQLKAFGYQFGDRIAHAHHPLIYNSF